MLTRGVWVANNLTSITCLAVARAVTNRTRLIAVVVDVVLGLVYELDVLVEYIFVEYTFGEYVPLYVGESRFNTSHDDKLAITSKAIIR